MDSIFELLEELNYDVVRYIPNSKKWSAFKEDKELFIYEVGNDTYWVYYWEDPLTIMSSTKKTVNSLNELLDYIRRLDG